MLCFMSFFFYKKFEGGEMNKIHGKSILIQNGLSIHKL
jgi:hypothetical protein